MSNFLPLVLIILTAAILGVIGWNREWIINDSWTWLGALSDNQESKSTTLRNLGLLVGAAIAIGLAVWRSKIAERQADAAQRQAEITQNQVEIAQSQIEIAQSQAQTAQQSLLHERYQRGAEMLGSDVLSVRMGGIYALQRLGEEHPDKYHIQIIRLFCAFVRNPTGAKGDLVVEYEGYVPFHKLREDLQEVMSAIANRSDMQINLERKNNYKLDLSGACLKYLWLERAKLSDVRLSWADLTGAYLIQADLFNAKLTHTNLSGATLAFANLSKGILRETILTDAKMHEAVLSNATLDHADLSNANLNSTRLDGATLYGTILSGTDFSFNAQGPAEGLTQWQLDCANADKDNPPKLARVIDAKTGRSLNWHGAAIDC